MKVAKLKETNVRVEEVYKIVVKKVEIMGDQTKEEKFAKLDGRNYQSWKFNIKLVLKEKGIFGFIDGSDVPQDHDETAKVKAAYKTRSEKAYLLIAINLEPAVQVHVVDTTDPREAREILRQQFSFVLLAQTVRLSRKFYTAKMQENDDLLEHLSNIRCLEVCQIPMKILSRV